MRERRPISKIIDVWLFADTVYDGLLLVGEPEPPPLDAQPPDSAKGKATRGPVVITREDLERIKRDAISKASRGLPICTCTPAERGKKDGHNKHCPAREA